MIVQSSFLQLIIDWMHDTARCLGYPSDSTRAARERAPGDNLQSACGPSIRPGGSPLAPVAQPSPRWLNSRTPASGSWSVWISWIYIDIYISIYIHYAYLDIHISIYKWNISIY